MVVYWDLAALWNFTLDYLLLLGTVRLAGLPVRRRRLAPAAALGAAYSVLALTRPFSAWGLVAALLLMCLVAFGRTERTIKLTLLFLLLACALGGAVALLGRAAGGMGRLARGIIYARLPWGVFFAAAGSAYLLLTLVFRNGARHGGKELVRARIEYGGKRVAITLLRDTGNTLTDPLTGEGVPVVEKDAIQPLISGKNDRLMESAPFISLRYSAVGTADGTLPAFRCDRLSVDGRDLGARLIAVSPTPVGDGGGYRGLWYGDEREEAERHELEAVME